MPRITSFEKGEFYHIYNRGTDKRQIFSDKYDYERFILSMVEFNSVEPIGSLHEKQFSRLGRPTSKLVEIVAFALLPNHYHFILKQVKDNGISEYIKRLAGGYTKYFNGKNLRSGALFQGKFKSIHVKTDDYLLQLTCYINGNPEIHKIAKVDSYPWSSYDEYINFGRRTSKLICNPETVLSQFRNIAEFKETLFTIIKDSSSRKSEIKLLSLE